MSLFTAGQSQMIADDVINKISHSCLEKFPSQAIPLIVKRLPEINCGNDSPWDPIVDGQWICSSFMDPPAGIPSLKVG